MTWGQKAIAAVIAIAYVTIAGAAIVFTYLWFTPIGPDGHKEFAAIVGIELTAIAALMGIVVSFFTLSTQIRAARTLADKNQEIQNAIEKYKGEIVQGIEDHKETIVKRVEDYKEAILKRIEDHKEEILKRVEDHKGVIQKGLEDYKKGLAVDLETLKAELSQQNVILTRTLDAKAAAYDKVVLAATTAYNLLQNLAKGEYEKDKIRVAEGMLREADALASNLDDHDKALFTSFIQRALNIADSAELLNSQGDQLKAERESLWNAEAPDLGAQLNALRDRSLFSNQKYTR